MSFNPCFTGRGGLNTTLQPPLPNLHVFQSLFYWKGGAKRMGWSPVAKTIKMFQSLFYWKGGAKQKSSTGLMWFAAVSILVLLEGGG